MEFTKMHTPLQERLRVVLAQGIENHEAQYLQRLFELRDKASYGGPKADRTGVGRFSMFGGYLTHNTWRFGPALYQTKKVHEKSVIAELCWFLRGDSNVKWLQEQGCSIWDEWAAADGSLGPIYPSQWRGIGQGFYGLDQIQALLHRAQTNPADSGNIVSAWNVQQLKDMALRPCHTMWQVCIEDGRLDLMLYQRSADWFLGVPFNAASYTILQILLAHLLGLEPGIFHHYFGDTHLYANQLEAADKHLQVILEDEYAPLAYYQPQSAMPRLEVVGIPTLAERPMKPVGTPVLMDIVPDNLVIHNYHPGPHIPAPVAV